MPLSVFVLLSKCLFSFEVSLNENNILSVTGLVICYIISIVQRAVMTKWFFL